MICVTGDVHQRSYRGTDTPYSSFSEVDLACKYARLAAQYGLRITLFLTGRTALEEPRGVQQLANMTHCQIGGHTLAAFRDPWSRIFKKIWRTPWGPVAHQSRDITRTIHALQRVTGKRIAVWRNHSYVNTPESPGCLERAGIEWLSDEVNGSKLSWEYVTPALRSLPINVLPDHENLLHGKYQPGQARPAQLTGRIGISEWLKQVKAQVETVLVRGGIATLLAHPLCMEVADGMSAFEEMCQFVQRFPNGWVSEASGSKGLR
ncbi:MAG: polysaccharide deacetylase family protein [Nitrospirales bacterium]|nr:polysaccharide deacetylase family protein [Nitrospirales bacterium]